METSKLKEYLPVGELKISKWGTTTVIVDVFNNEVAHVNPYGNSTIGQPSRKHMIFTEAIIAAMNNTYQSGLDPERLPVLLSRLSDLLTEMKVLELNRNVKHPTALAINGMRTELTEILEDIKIKL